MGCPLEVIVAKESTAVRFDFGYKHMVEDCPPGKLAAGTAVVPQGQVLLSSAGCRRSRCHTLRWTVGEISRDVAVEFEANDAAIRRGPEVVNRNDAFLERFNGRPHALIPN